MMSFAGILSSAITVPLLKCSTSIFALLQVFYFTTPFALLNTLPYPLLNLFHYHFQKVD